MSNKITIDDEEFNVDDFNEEQLKILGEVQYVLKESERLSYIAEVMKARNKALATLLMESLKKEE
jgi:hypothetical protein